MTNTGENFSVRDYQLLAHGWDAAIAAMAYEDGTRVEIAENSNPWRKKAGQ